MSEHWQNGWGHRPRDLYAAAQDIPRVQALLDQAEGLFCPDPAGFDEMAWLEASLALLAGDKDSVDWDILPDVGRHLILNGLLNMLYVEPTPRGRAAMEAWYELMGVMRRWGSAR